MFRLAQPLALILLILLPFVWMWMKRKNGHVMYSSLEGIKKVSVRTPDRSIVLRILRMLTLSLLIFSISRPQSGKSYSEVESLGVDIMLLLDTSGSMQAMDFKKEGDRVNRLSIVKNVVGDFIRKRKGDRLGLVVFGTEAYTQCPLTKDHDLLQEFLDQIQINMAGEATAIGQAIAVGANRMKELKAKSKVIILLTDGVSNAGKIDPIEAAKLAAALDIRIYTIGVGTSGEAPFPVQTIFGSRLMMQPVEFDDRPLKEIASLTRGKYFSATNTNELKEVYSLIDSLEKTSVKVREFYEYNELYHYFIFPALLLFLLETILGLTFLRRLP